MLRVVVLLSRSDIQMADAVRPPFFSSGSIFSLLKAGFVSVLLTRPNYRISE
jgi:hypothetical protein